MTHERWFSLGSPLTGRVLGGTTVEAAAVFQRSVPASAAPRAVSDELIAVTLNLATGLGNRKHDRNNATVLCDGRMRRRWICMIDAVANVVVDDLRRLVVPNPRGEDPVIVLMVQEARPLLVDAIADRMRKRFQRPISTLFVTQEPDATLANTRGRSCDDGDPPVSYRCEYGNALLSSVPLTPRTAMNFVHRPENRMFVAATITVGAVTVTIATYHAQIDTSSRRGQQAEEHSALSLLASSLNDPVVLGGDFNNKQFDLVGFTKHDPHPRRVDALLSRPALLTQPLPVPEADSLRVTGYDLDHERLAVKWALRRR